jgi:hypothetical protein
MVAYMPIGERSADELRDVLRLRLRQLEDARVPKWWWLPSWKRRWTDAIEPAIREHQAMLRASDAGL